jgi:hypothetical protein
LPFRRHLSSYFNRLSATKSAARAQFQRRSLDQPAGQR